MLTADQTLNQPGSPLARLGDDARPIATRCTPRFMSAMGGERTLAPEHARRIGALPVGALFMQIPREAADGAANWLSVGKC